MANSPGAQRSEAVSEWLHLATGQGKRPKLAFGARGRRSLGPGLVLFLFSIFLYPLPLLSLLSSPPLSLPHPLLTALLLFEFGIHEHCCDITSALEENVNLG